MACGVCGVWRGRAVACVAKVDERASGGIAAQEDLKGGCWCLLLLLLLLLLLHLMGMHDFLRAGSRHNDRLAFFQTSQQRALNKTKQNKINKTK